MALIDVTVTDIVQETPTVKSLQLSRLDGTPIGKYLPGAHIDIVGPTSITRQYSLCSRPDAEDGFVVAVKREENSRGGSAALHDLKLGDTLKISEPRNLLEIAPDAAHHVLIAAGIGITPMLSMARYMDVQGISFELHYFARTEEDAAFLPLLRDRCPEKLHAHMGVGREEQDRLLEGRWIRAPLILTCICAALRGSWRSAWCWLSASYRLRAFTSRTFTRWNSPMRPRTAHSKWS